MENDEELKPQLFEMIGQHFRLPVWVSDDKATWNSGCVRVAMPKMPWLKKQREVVESTLDLICVRREGADWILQKTVSEQWLVASAQEEPEEVVVWNFIDKELPVDADFISQYCQHRDAVFRDPSFVTILWASLCKFSLWWLLHKNRPLDLGFVKLVCVPLRRNWLAILERKHHGAMKYKRFKLEKFLQENASEKKLTAWDAESETLRWDITATPTRRFHDNVKLVELQRKRLNTQKAYSSKIRSLLKDHYPRICELFKTYLAQADFKNVRLSRGKYGSRKRGFNHVLQRRWDEQDKPVMEGPSIGMDHLFGVDRVLETGAENGLARTDAGLPKVPFVESLCPDLRDVRRNVAEAGIESDSNGAVGLRLLDASQSETHGKLLAVGQGERDDAGNALAGCVEQLPDSAHRNGEEK